MLVQLVNLEMLEDQVVKDLLVIQVFKELLVPLDHLGKRDSLALLEIQVSRETKVHLDLVGQMGILDFKVHLDCLERKEIWDHPDLQAQLGL